MRSGGLRRRAGGFLSVFLMGMVLCGEVAGRVSFGQASQGLPRDSRAFVHETVQSLTSVIGERYFDRAAIPGIDKALAEAEARGDYGSVKDVRELAGRLTETLYGASHDKHLYVVPASPDTSKHTTASLPRAERGRMENFGLKKAEILRGNLGYLKIDAFYRASEGRGAVEAAMRFVQNADALILDLRENGGGSADTAMQLLSYFFRDTGTPLLSIIPRDGEATVYRTQTYGVAYREQARPVFVLVSNSTWAAGEGVAFVLQKTKRATVIGETTAGAGNPGGPWPVNAALTVNVPSGRIEVAACGCNWEGRGVIPDVTAVGEDGLRVARVAALKELAASTTDEAKRRILSDQLTIEMQR